MGATWWELSFYLLHFSNHPLWLYSYDLEFQWFNSIYSRGRFWLCLSYFILILKLLMFVVRRYCYCRIPKKFLLLLGKTFLRLFLSISQSCTDWQSWHMFKQYCFELSYIIPFGLPSYKFLNPISGIQLLWYTFWLNYDLLVNQRNNNTFTNLNMDSPTCLYL